MKDRAVYLIDNIFLFQFHYQDVLGQTTMIWKMESVKQQNTWNCF